MDELAWFGGINSVTADTERVRVLTDRLDETEALEDLTRLAFRVAYSVLRHREDAEEVAQESVLTACRKFASLREPDSVCPWLVRIAWRRALDHRRTDERREAREALRVSPPRLPTPEELASEKQRSAQLWDAIDELPEKLRQTLVLASIEGHDLQTVAIWLDIPIGTVKSRLYYARKTLLEKLQ